LSGPGDGLDSALLGQRYLLTEGTGDHTNPSNPTAWAGTSGQPLVASANDIIEFNGSRWLVVFVSSDQSTVNYVTNIHTGTQYEWTGTQWIKSYQGVYDGGTWSIVL